MRRTARVATAVSVLAAMLVAGCAGTRIDEGVFHSKKGYRVAMPGGDWTVASGGTADLTLKHRDGRSGIVVNAGCDGARTRGSLAILARHLLAGLRDRSVVTREDVSVNGTTARHAVIDGRAADTGEPVRVELYVMRDERCLYDFLYAAPPETFDARRADFERVVHGFRTD